jgi:thymidylate synthase (FAD)
MYTYWYWKIDLHNLLHFLDLRLAKDAQWEIRQYAKAIAGLVKLWCPITWKAFQDYRLHGVYFSRAEMLLMRYTIAGGNLAWSKPNLEAKAKSLGITKTELSEFLDKYYKCDEEPEQYDLDIGQTKDPETYEKLASDSVSKLQL